MTAESQEVIVHDAHGGAMAASMPRLMELAIQSDKVDALERLVALDERMSARRAAQEFAEAMARFKHTCPAVPRRTENAQFKVTRNGTQQARRYATLEDIEATVRGPLASCGLSFRWGDSRMEGGNMTLACVVSHVGGHSVSASVTLPVESRAGCSEAQKYGAVMTYAQRYSLIQALGLTTCDEDTDGAENPAPEEKITPNQVDVLIALLEQRPPGSLDRLLAWTSEQWGAKTLDGIPAAQFEWLRADLEKKIRGAK